MTPKQLLFGLSLGVVIGAVILLAPSYFRLACADALPPWAVGETPTYSIYVDSNYKRKWDGVRGVCMVVRQDAVVVVRKDY